MAVSNIQRFRETVEMLNRHERSLQADESANVSSFQYNLMRRLLTGENIYDKPQGKKLMNMHGTEVDEFARVLRAFALVALNRPNFYKSLPAKSIE